MSFWLPSRGSGSGSGSVLKQFNAQNSFLTKVDALDTLVDALALCVADHQRCIASLGIGPIRPAGKKTRSFVDKIPKDHAFWHTFQAVSQCLNCIYLNLITNRSDTAYVAQHLCSCFKGDVSLLTTLLDVVRLYYA